jgi:hypothetical protein
LRQPEEEMAIEVELRVRCGHAGTILPVYVRLQL